MSSKKFGGSIVTDGVAVSFDMCKIVPKLVAENNITNANIEMYRRRLANTEYRTLLGLGPGYVLTLGGVRQDFVSKTKRKNQAEEPPSPYQNRCAFMFLENTQPMNSYQKVHITLITKSMSYYILKLCSLRFVNGPFVASNLKNVFVWKKHATILLRS